MSDVVAQPDAPVGVSGDPLARLGVVERTLILNALQEMRPDGPTAERLVTRLRALEHLADVVPATACESADGDATVLQIHPAPVARFDAGRSAPQMPDTIEMIAEHAPAYIALITDTATRDVMAYGPFEEVGAAAELVVATVDSLNATLRNEEPGTRWQRPWVGYVAPLYPPPTER